MRYVVAVKQVPDTMEMSVDENWSLVRVGVPAVLNIYDEYALTKVLDMRREGDEVVVFTMGPDQARKSLRRCLELGADRAYLLTDRAFAGADVWATARTITAFILRIIPDADLYVFGRQAIDGNTGQVPYEVAAQLGVQQFAYTESLSVDGNSFVAVQDYGDMKRTCKVPSGSVVSFGAVNLNGVLPTIESYLRGRDAEILEVDRVRLCLGLYSVGLKGSKTKIVTTGTLSLARRNRKVEISNPANAAEFIIDEIEALR